MIEKNIKILLLYIFLGLVTTIYILGFDYISFFTNSSWLSSRDMTADLISWQYFKNDIWRFPIGNNPNDALAIIANTIKDPPKIPICFSGFIEFSFW